MEVNGAPVGSRWVTDGNLGKPRVRRRKVPGRALRPARLRPQRAQRRRPRHRRHNTTQHLVADLELLREHLGIDRWLVCGGSWGRTLALAWARWEETVLSLEPNANTTPFSTRADDELIEFARVCSHYYADYGWLADDELIGNVDRLAAIPGVLVHGRLDLSCPVETAYELASAWPGAELFVCDESGHRSSEAKRSHLRAAMARFADKNIN